MNRRKAFTLIELLVVLALLAILITVGLGVIGKLGGGFNKTIQGEVIDKWTDFDYENNKFYRIRTRAANGEVDTWDSYWVHDQIQPGQTYELKISLGRPTEVKAISTEQKNGQLQQPTPGQANNPGE